MKKKKALYQKIIRRNGKIIAIVFKKTLRARGVKFLTPANYTLQLGLLEHPKGKVIRDHQHNTKIKYWVDTTQEFLYLEKGKVKAKFFDDEWNLIAEEILMAGDFLLHISGGHGFEVLEKCRMIEIKQGPYPGEKMAKVYKEA
jgi:hypothetical protein